MAIPLTIIIATRNRPTFLERAIQSALKQGYPELEIIVIDDASVIDYTPVITGLPVKYVRLESNEGPCVARNKGIALASNDWLISLDDDDELLPCSLEQIAASIEFYENNGLDNKPVYMFASSTTKTKSPTNILTIYDLFYLKGETLPLINKGVFLNNNLRYPDFKLGGESLLWWEVAKKWGAPYSSVVCLKINTDGPCRLTHAKRQARMALDYANFQKERLLKFKKEIESHPCINQKIHMAAATYYLLGGNRKECRFYLHKIIAAKKSASILYALSFLPAKLIKSLYLLYRARAN